MKAIILTLAMTMSLLITSAQNKEYFQKMGQTLQEMGQSKSIQDFQKVANTFQVISNNEKGEWLPQYYNSFSYIIMSFMEKDAEKKDDYLDLAEKSLEISTKLAPAEAENYALKSFLYTARLVVNPMQRGQKYSILSATETQKALKLDSTNVRAKYLSLSGRMGKAQFFGESTEQYCDEANDLLLIWDDFEQKSPLHPNWGKNDVQNLVKNCEIGETKEEIKAVKGNTLTIKFPKLKDGGNIRLKLLNKKEETVKAIIQKVENKECVIIIEGIENGTYAVQYFHDQNNNEKLDVSKYGKPTEGYGFSNNARGFMSAPKFASQLFEIKNSETISLKTTY